MSHSMSVLALDPDLCRALSSKGFNASRDNRRPEPTPRYAATGEGRDPKGPGGMMEESRLNCPIEVVCADASRVYGAIDRPFFVGTR